MVEQAGDFSQHRYEEEIQPSSSVEIRPSAPMLSLAPVSDPTPVLDMDRRLETLLQAVGEDIAHQFFWKAETGTIQTYEHRLTYRYVHIDRVTGQFCDQQRNPVSAEKALAHALPSLAISRPVMSMMLAPIVLEPDLLPFVRPVSGAPEPLPSAGSEQMALGSVPSGSALARVYRHFRVKFLSLGAFATVRSAPDQVREGHVHLQESDLSLASFTRRPA